MSGAGDSACGHQGKVTRVIAYIIEIGVVHHPVNTRSNWLPSGIVIGAGGKPNRLSDKYQGKCGMQCQAVWSNLHVVASAVFPE